MNVNFMPKLFKFNFWENRRLWDLAIIPLTDEQFNHDTGYSWGTIQRECVHIMDGEASWLRRVKGQSATSLRFDELATRDLIRARWDAIERDWQSYLMNLDNARFSGLQQFTYRDKEVAVPVWKILLHVVNHGTLHRAEILKMVAEVHQPADFDLSMMQYFTGVFR